MQQGRLIYEDKVFIVDNISGSKNDQYIICPVCTPTRQDKHKHEKKLCITVSKRTARCNHCGLGFKFVFENEYNPAGEYAKFDKFLDSKIIQYFAKRGISQQALDRANVKSCNRKIRQKDTGRFKETLCMAFTFIYKNEEYGIKYRDGKKNFAFEKGSKLIPLGMQNLNNDKPVLIVEGEIDYLSYIEAGYLNVISVPAGVSISPEEKKLYEETGQIIIENPLNLKYIDEVIDTLDLFDEFVIGTDADAGGYKLRTELIRRLGKERCKFIDYSDYECKDGNDVLKKHGAEVLLKTISEAKGFKIDDIITLGDSWEDILRLHTEGYTRGKSTGFPSMDPHFNWMFGDLIIVNGYPNMGKTAFVLNLVMLSAIYYDWKWGLYLPENYPIYSAYAQLIEIFVGNTMDVNSSERISRKQLEEAKKFIESKFELINRSDGYSPHELRNIGKQMIKKRGIVGLVTDPWNALIHKTDGNLDDYLEKELSSEQRFAINNGIIKIINAHPPTPRNVSGALEPPSPHQIRGGNIWWNKAYEMICIHDPMDPHDNTVRQVYIQKVKNWKTTGVPTKNDSYISFTFERRSGRYIQSNGYNPFSKEVKSTEQINIDFTEF